MIPVRSYNSGINVDQRELEFFRPDQVFLNPDCRFGCFANRCINDETAAAAKLQRICEAAGSVPGLRSSGS